MYKVHDLTLLMVPVYTGRWFGIREAKCEPNTLLPPGMQDGAVIGEPETPFHGQVLKEAHLLSHITGVQLRAILGFI
jgi:hypothetical protein